MSAPVHYNAQHGMSYTPAAASTGWSPETIATILAGVSQGASSAMNRPGYAALANNKKDAREAKRRTLANSFNAAMQRRAALSNAGQQHADDMNDFQSQAMQQVARGFVQALQGSTG